MNPALSKPSFCPSNEGKKYQLVICGTEEQDPYKKDQNKLVFMQLEDNKIRQTNGSPAVWTYRIENVHNP